MLSIGDMQEAAKLIEVDGDEAYHAVSARYGEDVARLLLVAHLRRSFGAMESFPSDPSIDGRVEDFLRERGITDVNTSIAHFSPTLARGVVYMKGRTYIIQVGKMYQPEDAGATNIGMWMQGPSDIQQMESGGPPFTAVYDRMRRMAEAAEAELLVRLQEARADR